MKTIKGYWEDAYVREFKSKVVSVDENKLILEKTYFYPAGGNQPGDQGKISAEGGKLNAQVIDTRKENGTIIHLLHENAPFKINDQIIGTINWERRYSLMRAHSAQHVLSSVVYQQYGLQTLRALIQPGEVVLYLSNSVGQRDFKQSLFATYEICCDTNKNLQIRTEILKKGEIKEKYERNIRGKIPQKETVRIVQIGNNEAACCSGTHVKFTNEIGPLAVTNFKGDEVQFTVGPAAYNELATNILEVLDVKQILRGAPGVLSTHFRRLKDETIRQKTHLERLLPIIVRSALDNAISFEDGQLIFFDAEFVSKKEIEPLIKEFPDNTITGVLIGGPSLYLYSKISTKHAGNIIKEFCQITGAKGGGNPTLAQASAKEIENPLEELKKIVLKN